MALKFFIQQAPDGKSFTFKDLTDWDDLTPDTTDVTTMYLEVTLPNEDEPKVCVLDDTEYVEEMEIDAFETPFSGLPDGVYKFRLLVETELSDPNDKLESSQVLFGFAAAVTQKVMRASLSYHPTESKRKKEWILELQRLLINLRYSAYTGNYNYFNENLKQLEKIL